jgi:Domain of unknown function (DUF4474)
LADRLSRVFASPFWFRDFVTPAVSPYLPFCVAVYLPVAKGKTWMIELWKGQYGLMTGCEIGVYNRSPKDFPSYYAYLVQKFPKTRLIEVHAGGQNSSTWY